MPFLKIREIVLSVSAVVVSVVGCYAQQMGTAVSTFLEFPVSAHTADPEAYSEWLSELHLSVS